MISTNLKDSAIGPLKASDKTKLSNHGVTIDLKTIYREPQIVLENKHFKF